MVFHLMHGMPFQEIFDLLGICRHCVVHGEGRLPEDGFGALNVNQIAFIRRCMRESILTGEETILPDRRQTGLVIEMPASYGYALYVLLSEKCGMEIDQKYFGRPGDPKKSRKASK